MWTKTQVKKRYTNWYSIPQLILPVSCFFSLSLDFRWWIKNLRNNIETHINPYASMIKVFCPHSKKRGIARNIDGYGNSRKAVNCEKSNRNTEKTKTNFSTQTRKFVAVYKVLNHRRNEENTCCCKRPFCRHYWLSKHTVVTHTTLTTFVSPNSFTEKGKRVHFPR